MSARNPDADYQAPTQSIPFIVSQALKRVYTSEPGRVVSYDAATKRARVQPALDVRLTQDAAAMLGMESIARPVLVDVPVLPIAGGGMVFHVPLAEGDMVALHYSRRGIEDFKRTYQVAVPPPEVKLAERDAWASPGFGSLRDFVPVSDGATIQTEDGKTYVEVHPDRIQARRGDEYVALAEGLLVINVQGDVALAVEGDVLAQAEGDVRITGGTVAIDGDVEISGSLEVAGSGFKHKGRNVGAKHRHTAVKSGPSTSGPPA